MATQETTVYVSTRINGQKWFLLTMTIKFPSCQPEQWRWWIRKKFTWVIFDAVIWVVLENPNKGPNCQLGMNMYLNKHLADMCGGNMT